MPKAAWYDPDRDLTVEEQLDLSSSPVRSAVAKTLGLRSGRGHPAVEFTRDDGTSLSIATDGDRALVIWRNSLDETFHSTGPDRPGPMLVFDYFGSWSEAPANHLVPLSDAMGSAEIFLRTGIPDTPLVIFSPD